MESLNNNGPLQFQEYTLEGGAQIRDKSNGVARAIYLKAMSEKHNQSYYRVVINGKKLIRPTCSDPTQSKEQVIFNGSQKITFKLKEGFIKISEKDAKGKTINYADPKNCVNNVAYDIYKYIPKELTLDEAVQKIKNLSEFTDFKPLHCVYNRHGVAVFGEEKGKNSLYWANPYEEKVKPMETTQCGFLEGGSAAAKSKDKQVNFRCNAKYSIEPQFYLNGEPAKSIDLVIHELQSFIKLELS